MNRLFIWLNGIIKKHKALKRWKRIVTVLAAIITFATTYALILPAITVERNNTEEVAGMYLEQEENAGTSREQAAGTYRELEAGQDDLFLENALEFTGVNIAADQENAVSFEYADESMTANAIFSTDEDIPEGSELVVNSVDPESEEYAALESRAAVLLDREFIYDVTTCSFYDFALICDGVDVTPKTGLVDVQIVFNDNTVEHVDDVVFAGRFARAAEETDGFVALAAGDVGAEPGASAEPEKDKLVSANPDESAAIELTDGIITALTLKGNNLTESDSLVGILAGYVDEEARVEAAETDAEIPDADDAQDEAAEGNSSDAGESLIDAADDNEENAAPSVKTLKASGSDYSVVLTYDETSKIPEGAYLTVSEIAEDSKEYQTYLEETKKAMGLKEEETLPRFAARFFDIKIMVGNDEFTPEAGVSVEITYAEPLADKDDAEVSAVHFADEKAKAEVIEANTTEVQDGGTATVEFVAESFSVYGVIYTVDFHYEVDGQEYTYSMKGGSYISLKEIVELTGLADQEPTSRIKESSVHPKSQDETEDQTSAEPELKNLSAGIDKNPDEPILPGENSNEEFELTEIDDAASVESNAVSADSKDNTDVSDVSNNTEGSSDELVDDTENTVIDEESLARLNHFIENVKNVEFSSPELICVVHPAEDTTVEALKESLCLECEYSATLTKEQIAEVNATAVPADEWGLISLKPFESEEILTVTMKNGDVFIVRVSDAMDPLGIDDRTVSFVYLTDTPNQQGRSQGYSLNYSGNNIRRNYVSYQKKNGVEYCDKSANAWLFEYVADKQDPNYGKYYISNGYHSDESIGKYLTFNNNSLQLVTGKANAVPVTISKVEGTDYYRIGDNTTGYVSYSNNYFIRSANPNNSNLNFCLPEAYDSNAPHKATLTSVQDIKPGQDVIIYRRVLYVDPENPSDSYTYHYYAINGNGGAERVYNNSDSIYWKGDAPVEWEIRDLGGYYAFYNPTTNTYLAPKDSDHMVLTTYDSESEIRISLPGKIADTYTSKISYWYNDGNVTNGIKVTEGSDHNSAAASVVLMDESDEFYFAVRDPAVQGELTEVDTLDNNEMGIKITMYNFDGVKEDQKPQNENYTPARLKFMNYIMGNEKWNQGEYSPYFVSRYLQDDGEYPTIEKNERYNWSQNYNVVGNSLGLLFENATRVSNGDPKKGTVTKTEDVTHLFLQNVYDATGYFHYSCFENAAYLNGNNFEVYEQLASSGSDAANYTERGNFWPYSRPKPEYTDHKSNNYNPDLLQYGSAQDPYDHTNGTSSFPRAGEDVYYVNDRQNNGRYNDPDCFFGMIMEAKFSQNENGLSDRGDPMVFKFNGDDDLWVYVDKVLLLDLGGVHDAFRGKINFQTGEIIITSPTIYDYTYYSDGSQTAVFNRLGKVIETTYIKEQFYQAGKLPDGSDWPTENGVKLKSSPEIDKFFTDGGETDTGKLIGTFKDNSTHDLKMFYMERGAGASQLEMSFNLPVLRDSSFRVKKVLPETTSNQIVQDDYADKQFYYEVYKGTDSNNDGLIETTELTKCKRSDFIKLNADTNTEEMTAKYEDASRSDLKWLTEEPNETKFLLKPGQTAVFPAPNTVNDKVYWYVVEVEKDDDSTYLNGFEVTNSDPNKSIDGDPNNPTEEDLDNPGTYTGKYTNGTYVRYLTSNIKTIKERSIVTYYNCPDDSLVNELQIKKKITGRPYDNNALNTFEYRILLETTEGKISVYREGDYYQIDKNGNYVYFDTYNDGSGKAVTDRKVAIKELHNGKLQYRYTYHTNASETYDEWCDEPKPTEKTSPRGSLGNILDGDTIVIKGLLEGTRFYVYERTYGYSNMAEADVPTEGKYIVDGVPIVTNADNWTEADISSLEADLEECGELASFSVSDYEKEHAAKGTIKSDSDVRFQDAKVLIKNKPYSNLDISLQKNWKGIQGDDELLKDSTIKVTLGRYVLKSEAGTLTLVKDGIPRGAEFYAKYVVKKISEEHPEGEVFKEVYYNPDMANGVTIPVDPGTYIVTEEIIYQDEGYTWYHSYLLSGEQTYGESSGNISITTNSIADTGSDTVTFVCQDTTSMKTNDLTIRSTLIDGDSGIRLSDVYYIVYEGDENSTKRATYPNGKKIPIISYDEAKVIDGNGGFTFPGLKVGEYTVKEIGVPEKFGKYARKEETSSNHSQTISITGTTPKTVNFVNEYEEVASGQTSTNAIIHVTSWQGHINIANTEYSVGSRIRLYYKRNASESISVTVNGSGTNVGNEVTIEGASSQNDYNASVYREIVLSTENVEIYINNSGIPNGQYAGYSAVSPSTTSIGPASRGLSAFIANRLLRSGNRDAEGDSGESEEPTPTIAPENYGAIPDPPEKKKYVDDPDFTMLNPEYDPGNPEETGPEIIAFTVTLDQDHEWKWESASHNNVNLPAADEDGNPYYYYVKSVEETGMPDGTVCLVKLDGEDKFIVGENVHDTIYNEETGEEEPGLQPLELTNIIPVDLDIIKVDKTNTEKKLPGAVFILRKLVNGKVDEEEVDYPIPTENGTFDGDELLSSDPAATDNEGKTSFKKLLPGYYELIESQPPAGYIQTSVLSIYVRVDDDVKVKWVEWDSTKEDPNKWVEKDEISSGDSNVYFSLAVDGVEDNPETTDVDETEEAVNATFTIKNEPGAALPSTGGHGTRIFTILGAILALGSGLVLFMRNGWLRNIRR